MNGDIADYLGTIFAIVIYFVAFAFLLRVGYFLLGFTFGWMF